jgi:hypothetical protein
LKFAIVGMCAKTNDAQLAVVGRRRDGLCGENERSDCEQN